MKKLLFILLLSPILSAAQSLDWQITDKTFSAGDTVTADFSAYGFDSITAYQFAMLYDTGALAFIGVTFPPGNPMGLSSGGFSWHGKPGYNVKPGELRHLRSMPYSKTFADGTHGFTYVFTAKQSGTLSQKMTLATCCLSPPLNPMSYRWILNYQALTVSYVAPGELLSVTSLKSQVRIYPNPTTDALWIDSPTPVIVRVYDAGGRLTNQAEITDKAALWPLNDGVNIVCVTDGKKTFLKTVIKL